MMVVFALIIVIILGLFWYFYCGDELESLKRRKVTIDCQPTLMKEDNDLCERAKEANYPYIVY